MKAIFGNSTPDPSVPGDEMSENDMIAQRTNDKKLRKGALKSLIKTADSLANKEKPEIIEAVNETNNDYDAQEAVLEVLLISLVDYKKVNK